MVRLKLLCINGLYKRRSGGQPISGLVLYENALIFNQKLRGVVLIQKESPP
jgi:hypothetical protein